MSNARIKHTDEQIQLAVDYIIEHHASILHPEDALFGFFVTWDKIQEKIAAMTNEERTARLHRETQYLEKFKTAARDYLQRNNPWCSGICSDYHMDNRELLEAVKGSNVTFRGGFWSVTLSQDGKVYHSEGKYGKNEEIKPKDHQKVVPEIDVVSNKL